ERLRHLAIDSRQAHVETGAELVVALRHAEVDFGVDRPIGRQGNLPLAGDESDRAHEARRPARGEELFRIRAGSRSAGSRELDVEPTVRGSRRAVAAAGRVSLRGVEDFVELSHGGPPYRLDDDQLIDITTERNTGPTIDSYEPPADSPIKRRRDGGRVLVC